VDVLTVSGGIAVLALLGLPAVLSRRPSGGEVPDPPEDPDTYPFWLS
jgi:hypothetical protein